MATRRASGVFREIGAGLGDLGGGLALWVRSPRLLLLGAIPALVVAVAWLVLYVLLLMALPGIAAALTPFAAGWAPILRESVRALAGAVVAGGAAVLLVLGYSAVTLAVGDPFYERISRGVDRRLGGAPAEPSLPWSAALRRAIGEGLRLFVLGALLAVVVFLLGLIPVVGTVVALLVGMLVGGRLLAVELTGFAFEARGVDLRGRRRALSARRARSQAFGAGAYLLLLLPPVAVIAMPAVVAGATLLTRAIADDPAD